MFALDSRINDEESKKNLEANKKKPYASASFYSFLKIHDN